MSIKGFKKILKMTGHLFGPEVQLFLFILVTNGRAFKSPYEDFENNAAFWRNKARSTLRQTLRRSTMNTNPAKNVILFIGDGMDISTITAGRIKKGQSMGYSGEENENWMDSFPYVGLSKVYTVDKQTPDSAGTATALLTGVKTKSKVIGLNGNATFNNCVSSKGNSVKTILEHAAAMGKRTGIVTTTHVTHATPASAYAHSPSRSWVTDATLPPEAKENGCLDIGSQLIRKGRKINVILGGGRVYLRPNGYHDEEYGKDYKIADQGRTDGRNLIEEWINILPSHRSRYVWNRDGFDEARAESVDYLLGLFEPGDMRYEHERENDVGGEPSLAEMTEKAIQILSKNESGFFLMVEGGRIDHAHHQNRANTALSEFAAFDEAVGVASRITREEDTLIVVTADHGHMFTMGGSAVRGNPLNGLAEDNLHPKMATDGKPYTSIAYGNGKEMLGNGTNERRNLSTDTAKNMDFRFPSAIPLAAETHSATDVAVLARGPMSYLFTGVYEQNYVGFAMIYASCVGPDKRHCKKQYRIRPWDCTKHTGPNTVNRKSVTAKFKPTLRRTTPWIPWWCKNHSRQRRMVTDANRWSEATHDALTGEKFQSAGNEIKTTLYPSAPDDSGQRTKSKYDVTAATTTIQIEPTNENRQTSAIHPTARHIERVTTRGTTNMKDSHLPARLTTRYDMKEAILQSNNVFRMEILNARSTLTTSSKSIQNIPIVPRLSGNDVLQRAISQCNSSITEMGNSKLHNFKPSHAINPNEKEDDSEKSIREKGDWPLATNDVFKYRNTKSLLKRTMKGLAREGSRRSSSEVATQEHSSQRIQVTQRLQKTDQMRYAQRLNKITGGPATRRKSYKERKRPKIKKLTNWKFSHANVLISGPQQTLRKHLATEFMNDNKWMDMTSHTSPGDSLEENTMTTRHTLKHPPEPFLVQVEDAVRERLTTIALTYLGRKLSEELDQNICVVPLVVPAYSVGEKLVIDLDKENLEATMVCMKWNSSSGFVYLKRNISEYVFRCRDPEQKAGEQMEEITSACGSSSVLAVILLSLLAILFFVLSLILLHQLRRKQNMLDTLITESERTRPLETQKIRIKELDVNDAIGKQSSTKSNVNESNSFWYEEKTCSHCE